MENLKQLLIAIDAFMDVRVINSARHSNQEADTLACEIERLMTELGCYDDEGKLAAALLGKRGGSVTTEAKAAASRANGKRGGRPRKIQASG